MPLPNQKTVEKYREISEKLANPSLLSELRGLFDRRYTLVELLEWLHEKGGTSIYTHYFINATRYSGDRVSDYAKVKVGNAH